jgi:hypothetical protein
VRLEKDGLDERVLAKEDNTGTQFELEVVPSLRMTVIGHEP